MPTAKSTFKQIALRETALFLSLFFFGLVLLPVGVYLVGAEVFGNYGGHGFGGFFGTLSSKIRSGEAVAWFLVLSPYLGWQILRLTALGWRLVGGPQNDGGTKPA